MRRYIDFHMTFGIDDDTSEIRTACTHTCSGFVSFSEHTQNIPFYSIPFDFISQLTVLYLQLLNSIWILDFFFHKIETFSKNIRIFVIAKREYECL